MDILNMDNDPYAFSEEEAAEMREMFASGFFPPEEQEMIRESVRKRESYAEEVLWATRLKYKARAKKLAPPNSEKASEVDE